MNPVASVGRSLVLLGLGVAAFGLLLIAASKVPHLGRLPGDIAIERPGFRFYFPLTTSILLSVVLSLLAILLRRHR